MRCEKCFGELDTGMNCYSCQQVCSSDGVIHYVAGTHDRKTACGIPIFSGTEISEGAINPLFWRGKEETGIYKITCEKCLSA